MADQPQDGRPEVSVTTNVRISGTDPVQLVAGYEVHCKYCGGYQMTPDVRTAIKRADKHEASEGHRLRKQERIAVANLVEVS